MQFDSHASLLLGSEKAEITVDGADELYREIRIENSFTDENGDEVPLRKGAQVDVTIEADLDVQPMMAQQDCLGRGGGSQVADKLGGIRQPDRLITQGDVQMIAGYDANPIDGLEGKKTAAALDQFGCSSDDSSR